MIDPYHRWLAIPPTQRPPTLYQILGVAADESDPAVIEEAALRQASHVRIYQTGQYAKECTKILNEIGQARATLLHVEKRKEYDARLETGVRARPPELPPPVPVPVESSRPRPVAGSALLPILGYGAVLLLGGAMTFVLALPQPGAADSSDLPGATTETPKPAPVPKAPPRVGASRRLQAHESAVLALGVTPDGLSALSAGGSGIDVEAIGCVPRLWSLRTRKILRLFPGHLTPIVSLAISGDGEQFLSSGGGYQRVKDAPAPVDCSVRLWDIKTGKQVDVFSEHKAPVRGVAFLPDGNRAISCDSDGAVYLWNLRGERMAIRLPGGAFPATCLAVSSDGRHVLAGGSDGSLHLWDLRKDEEINRFPSGKSPIHATEFSHDNRLIAAASGAVDYRKEQIVPRDCVVRVWETTSASEKPLLTLKGHTQPVLAVTFARKKKWILSGGLDGTVRVWSAKTGKQLHQFSGPGSGITSVVLMESRGEVLAGCLGGSIEVWDLPDKLDREEASP